MGRWLAVLAFALALVGCSGNGGYPEGEPTSFVGRSARCAHCDKTIESVTEENLMTFEGVVYPVCNSQCAEELKAWLREQ